MRSSVYLTSVLKGVIGVKRRKQKMYIPIKQS